jgi:amino acid adenylation domain-containing protein
MGDREPLSPAARALLTRRATGGTVQAGPGRTSGPLSFPQLTQWFFAHLHPESTVFNLPKILDLRGTVSVDALGSALQRIVDRHAALRTVYRLEGDEPVQEARPPRSVQLEVHDLRERASAASDAEALLEADAARRFDLASDQLLRATLLRLADARWRLQVTFHHIAFDGWSTDIFLDELGHGYRVACHDSVAPRAALEVQFPEVAATLRDIATGPAASRQKGFWRERLSGVPATDPLLDAPPEEMSRHRGAQCLRTMPHALWDEIRRYAQERGVTPFAVTAAGWALLTGRRAGQSEFVLGVMTAGRSRAEWEPMIGNFVNVLPLVVDLDDPTSFDALVRQVRQRSVEAFANQDIAVEQFAGDMAPARRSGLETIFPVLFNFRNFPLRLPDDLPGLSVTAFSAPARGTTAPLTLDFTPDGEQARVRLDYDPDRLSSESAAQWLDGYLALLGAAMSAPDASTASLPVMGAAERSLLRSWNATERPLDREATLASLFERQALATPDRGAVTALGVQWSYRELDHEANRVAALLFARGIGRGTFVGVCMERCAGLAAALLGVLKSGAAYVPLDPTVPIPRLAGMIEDAGISVLLTGPGTPEGLDDSRWESLRWDELPGPFPMIVERAALTGAEPAFVIFTSGSTGRPKGVAITHRNAVNYFTWARSQYGTSGVESVLQVTSLGFDAAAWEVWLPLLHGDRLVMARPGDQLDPPALLALIIEEEITMLGVVPSMLRALLETGRLGEAGALRLVSCGGEAMTWDLVADFGSATSATLVNEYGPTECCIASTCWVATGRAASGPVPIGPPIANTQVHVLDANGTELPIGTPGELVIGGDGVALGYLNRPELTAERFVPDPWRPGYTMYRTGDLGRWRRDGQLEFLGRLDHQVKLRGFRIELDEIDLTLRSHPGVQAAATVLRHDSPGGARLVSYVVGLSGSAPDAASLRAHLRTTLPEYMVPAAFVFLAELPMTSSRKLDRSALPAPDPGGAGHDPDPPQGEVELAIAGCWNEVMPTPLLGRHTSFLDAGGHSLLAVRFLAAIQRRLGRTVSLADFLRRPTIAQLADLLVAPMSPERPAITAQPRRTSRRP